MKMENQFFRFFFYPFLIGVIISAIIIILFSILFTINYIDKITGNNLVNLEKEYVKINIHSGQVLVSSALYKVQNGLNELVSSYIKIANQLKTNKTDLNRNINDDFFKCILEINDTYNLENKQTYYMAYWLIDSETNSTNLRPNSDEKNQLIAFSNIIQNIYSIFYSTNSTTKIIYGYFDSTDIYISFPLSYEYETDFFYELTHYGDNPLWCLDKNGEIYTVYKPKCRGFYRNIKNAKTDIFDENHKDNENRTIYVTDFYVQASGTIEIIFTMCLEFIDPFSNNFAYFCSDVDSYHVNVILDEINSKMSGYFFINPVGFSHSFYFPENQEEALTLTENLFGWDKKFFLEEKMHFLNKIQRLMTSNYIKYINDSIYSEIFINGENADNQIFYLNGEKFHYSIYPIVLENINGIKEHVLNIIYVYNNKFFYNEIKSKINGTMKIIIELFIFIIFGSGLLYIIILSFNILAKYIVIPIKNSNYMLKGINIGGKNRLEYLDYLKKRQDDNEMLEKIILNEFKNNSKDKNKNEENNQNKESINNNKIMKEDKNKKNEFIIDQTIINKNDIFAQKYSKENNETFVSNKVNNSNIDNYNEIEDENDIIEEESNFYEFDEQ